MKSSIITICLIIIGLTLNAQVRGNPFGENRTDLIERIENYSLSCDSIIENLKQYEELVLNSIHYFEDGKLIKVDNYSDFEKISSTIVYEYDEENKSLSYRSDSYKNRYDHIFLDSFNTKSIKYWNNEISHYTICQYNVTSDLVNFKCYSPDNKFTGGEIYRYDSKNNLVYSQLYNDSTVYYTNYYFYDDQGLRKSSMKFKGVSKLVKETVRNYLDDNSYEEVTLDLMNNTEEKIRRVEEFDIYNNLVKIVTLDLTNFKSRVYVKKIFYVK